MGTLTLYSENFESYSIGASLIGAGANQWTSRTNAPAFTVVSGKYGNMGGTDWSVVTCNDSDLTSIGDCSVEFDVKAAASGRFIFGVHVTATTAIWCQCSPDVQFFRFFKVTNGNGYDFINSTLNLIANFDAYCPASLPFHIKVTISGNTYSVQVDGGTAHDFTDTSSPSGTIGFSTYAGGWQVDNISVTQTVPDPPAWATGYPKEGTVTASSVQLLSKIDVDGTGYFVGLPHGATAPTSAQVKAGQDSTGTAVAVNLKGSVSLTANTEASMSATSLSADTLYNFYLAAEGTVTGLLQTSPSEVVSITAAPAATNESMMRRGLLKVKPYFYFKLNLGSSLGAEQDITRDVANAPDIDETISGSNLDTGGMVLPSLTVELRNHFDQWNANGRNFQGGFVNNSVIGCVIKYIDDSGAVVAPGQTFEGLLKLSSSTWNTSAKTFSASVLDRSNLFQSNNVEEGVLTPGFSFTQAVYALLHRQWFTKYCSISLGDINLGYDAADMVDDPTELLGKTIKDALDQIAFLSGSIYYIDPVNNKFVMEPINPSTLTSVCQFGRKDIFEILEYGYDWLNQYTSFLWDDGEATKYMVEMSAALRDEYQYDFKQHKIDAKFTRYESRRVPIMNYLLTVSQYLKRKIQIRTKWNPDIRVNNFITIDLPRRTINPSNAFVWNRDKWNAGKVWGIKKAGIVISPATYWRVIGMSKNALGQEMTITARVAGIGPDDNL